MLLELRTTIKYSEDINSLNVLFFFRFGGLRNRRVLETHSKSLEEAPSYYRDHEAREAEEWEHRSWCGGWPGQSEHHVSGHQPLPGHHNHRRLPQTPRRPSTLLSMSGVSSLGLPGQQQTNINGQSLLNQWCDGCAWWGGGGG